jgi:hypothetical protein
VIVFSESNFWDEYPIKPPSVIYIFVGERNSEIPLEEEEFQLKVDYAIV